VQLHTSVIVQLAEMEVVEDSPADLGGFCLDHNDDDYDYGGNDGDVSRMSYQWRAILESFPWTEFIITGTLV
jgi:hypothetical protein